MSADGHMRYYLWLLILTAFNCSLYKKMNQYANKITRNWSLNFNTGPRANKDSRLLKWSRLVDYLSRGRGAVVFWGIKHHSLKLKNDWQVFSESFCQQTNNRGNQELSSHVCDGIVFLLFTFTVLMFRIIIYRNKIVVIEFMNAKAIKLWATWCQGCEKVFKKVA